MSRAGRCGELDFHRMEFAVDDDEQIHFQPVMGSPKMQFRFSAQRQEGFDCFGNDPPLKKRAAHWAGKRGGRCGLTGEEGH